MFSSAYSIAGLLIALSALAGRLYFYFQGKKTERLERELDDANEIIDAQIRKKTREDILRRSPALRERLLNRSSKK